MQYIIRLYIEISLIFLIFSPAYFFNIVLILNLLYDIFLDLFMHTFTELTFPDSNLTNYSSHSSLHFLLHVLL